MYREDDILVAKKGEIDPGDAMRFDEAAAAAGGRYGNCKIGRNLVERSGKSCEEVIADLIRVLPENGCFKGYLDGKDGDKVWTYLFVDKNWFFAATREDLEAIGKGAIADDIDANMEPIK